MNEVLSIDTRIPLQDSEIENYTNYFFEVLEQREAGQLPDKKGSINNTRDFILAKMNYNGISSVDERLKGSRFNFNHQEEYMKQKYSNYQQYDNDCFSNQMNYDNGFGCMQQVPQTSYSMNVFSELSHYQNQFNQESDVLRNDHSQQYFQNRKMDNTMDTFMTMDQDNGNVPMVEFEDVMMQTTYAI